MSAGVPDHTHSETDSHTQNQTQNCTADSNDILRNDTHPLIYRINDRDELIFFNDQWQHFAQENIPVHRLAQFMPEAMLGQSLWKYISDPTTRQIYQKMLERIAPGERICFGFRCDAPTCRRLMQMEIVGAKNGDVEFRSTLVEAFIRPEQILLDVEILRTQELLNVCSWCNRAQLQQEWFELEEAVGIGRIFEQDNLPAISHGICEECYRSLSETVRSTSRKA